MGQSGKSERGPPKRSSKSRGRKAANPAQAPILPRNKPLVVSKIGKDHKSQFCQPRAEQPQDREDSLATLAKQGDTPAGLAQRENIRAIASRSSPPASRNLEEFIVPDSEEETSGDGSSCLRPLKLRRTYPPSDNSKLFVPDSPEETVRTPPRTLLPSTNCFPGSSEGIADGPSSSDRAHLQLQKSVGVRNNDESGVCRPELNASCTSKHSGEDSYNGPDMVEENGAQESGRLSPSMYVLMTANPVLVTPSSTTNRTFPVRSTGLKRLRSSRGDGPVSSVKMHSTLGTRLQGDLHKDVRTCVPSVNTSTGSTAPFPSIGKEPPDMISAQLAWHPQSSAISGVSSASTSKTRVRESNSGLHADTGGEKSMLRSTAPVRLGRTPIPGAGISGVPLVAREMTIVDIQPTQPAANGGRVLSEDFITANGNAVTISPSGLVKATFMLRSAVDAPEAEGPERVADEPPIAAERADDEPPIAAERADDEPPIAVVTVESRIGTASRDRHLTTRAFQNSTHATTSSANSVASSSTGNGHSVSVSSASLGVAKMRPGKGLAWQGGRTTSGSLKTASASMTSSSVTNVATASSELAFEIPVPGRSGGSVMDVGILVGKKATGFLTGDDKAATLPSVTSSASPSSVVWEAKVELHTRSTSNSLQRYANNANIGASNAKPPYNAGARYQINTRPFKPPRVSILSNDEVPSKVTPVLVSSVNVSSGLNSPIVASRHPQPPKSTYFLHTESISGRRRLRDYLKCVPASLSGVKPDLGNQLLMTSDGAENFRIDQLTEAGRQRSVGSSEIFYTLLGLGADEMYASESWVANHFKWIVWKMASSERVCAMRGALRPLTVDNVLQELKYRYDMELSGRRSAIRRVTEGDYLPASRMILCVSAIRHRGYIDNVDKRTEKIATEDFAKIEVTDGWYRLNAVLDGPLTKLVREGKLIVGQKINVCGANLCCCSDPKPPLEAFQTAFLRLHMNGTNRVPLGERLGLCGGPFIPLAFERILPGGGPIPRTYVGIKRVYPVLYREKLANNASIIRSAHAEEEASSEFEERRANVARDAMKKLESLNFPIPQDEKDEDDDLYEAVEGAAEPDIIMADMTAAQLRGFPAYQAKREARRQAATESAVEEALQQAGLSPRIVTPLLKVQVSGLIRTGDVIGEAAQETGEGMITIWNYRDIMDISEGSAYSVCGLWPSTWDQNPRGNRGQPQLHSYRTVTWELLPSAISEKHFWFPYTSRASTRLTEIHEQIREFDIAAVVLHIGEPVVSGSRTHQWVFVSDGSRCKYMHGNIWREIHVLAVRMNMPTAAFVPFDFSLLGSVVGLCNLVQQPKDTKNCFLVAEASELSIISSNWACRPVTHLRAPCESVAEWVKESYREIASVRRIVQDSC